jgi:HSP20 family molecular chaperone IbpA
MMGAEGMKSTKRGSETSLAEFLNHIVLIAGILAIAVVVALLIRVQRGLLGMALAAVAVGLLVYWISEFRKTVKKELSVPSVTKWSPDIFHQGDEIIVVGAVPGSDKKVNAEFRNGTLELRGEQRFHEFVNLGEHLKIEETKYVNRVLQVRLRKESVPSKGTMTEEKT